MITPEFDPGVVDRLTMRLDAEGLDPFSDQLVVVGGAALAAYGVKNLNGTDIDVVVTEEVFDWLGEERDWTKVHEYKPDSGLKSVSGSPDVTALVMPLNDRIYAVTSRQLIAERVTPQGWQYGFSPLARILSWKLALVNSSEGRADRDRHMRDLLLISQYMLARTVGVTV